MSKKIYKATPLYPRTKKENIIDFPIIASDISSENARNNQILTADGQGGTKWKTLLGTVSDVQLNNVSVVEDTVAKLNSDSQPVQNSTNLVESGGTYTVIKNEEERAKQAEADINNRINDLDLLKVGNENTNAYVKYVSQENGQLSAQAGTFDTTIENDPSNITAPTTSAVKTYVDTSITDNINALDVSDITSNLGVGKTITALSETDGKISATASNISITSEQVNDKVTTITQESNNIPTTTAVKAYIDTVDSSAVHKTGEEVITGVKQFNNGLKVGNVNGGWKEYQNGSGFLKIAQGDTDILKVGNYVIWPETPNSVDLGGEQHTFKDLYLSGNLKDGSATRTISSIQPTYAYSNANNLNLFDTTPTQNSTNPVTSGGIKDYVDTYGGKIDTVSVNNIQQTIINKNVDITVPTKTSDLTNDGNGSSNFATENFVNSSIASNTANFIGTFDSLTDLKADQQPKTNNDYAFVKNSTVYYDTTNPPTDFPTKADLDAYNKTNLTNYDYAWVINVEDTTKFDLYRYDIVQESWNLRLSKISKDEVNLNVAYNRYKYAASNTSWEYEYTLNNSSFTNEQWQAINSGITTSLVSDLNSNTQARHTHTNKSILDNTTASYTTEEETKLSGIETGAQVNVQADWTEADTTADSYIKNKPTVAPVGGVGKYVKTVGQSNGTLSSSDQTFDTTIDNNSDNNNAPTSLAVKNYVDTYGGKIDSISVNGTPQTITNKNVNITVPTTYLESASTSGNTLTITPASGDNIVFTPTFTDTNTWRAIKVNGVQKLDTSISGNALDLVAGSDITLTESNGAVTITAAQPQVIWW